MTISERLRREPQKGKKEFSAYRGFTVIELMMAVAVLAIVTSLALPSYRAIIEKRQVTSGAEQFAAFFGAVKVQAVKRNHDMGMYPDTYTDANGETKWCLGFKDYDGTACNCTQDFGESDACTVDLNNDGTIGANELTVLNSDALRKPDTLTGINYMKDGAAANVDHFVFDSVRGFVDDVYLADHADGMNIDFVSGQYELAVRIDRLGRTYSCSPDSDKAVPGYPSC